MAGAGQYEGVYRVSESLPDYLTGIELCNRLKWGVPGVDPAHLTS